MDKCLNCGEEDKEKQMTIKNIHRGIGQRSHIVYAELRAVKNDELIISATIDFILDAIQERKYNVNNIYKR